MKKIKLPFVLILFFLLPCRHSIATNDENTNIVNRRHAGHQWSRDKILEYISKYELKNSKKKSFYFSLQQPIRIL